MKIDYSGFERTHEQRYFNAIQDKDGPLRYRHERTAQPITIPGVEGDFYCIVGEEISKQGVAPYCIICEGLTGGKLHTDFTKETAIYCVQQLFAKFGTDAIIKQASVIKGNISPRYRKKP